MKQHAQGGARNHEKVGNGQVPQLHREQAPDLEAQREARVLHVAEHGGDAHDGQANPEEVEEAMEVAVVAVGIEVTDARGVVDCWEETTALLGADLFARCREVLEGWRGVFGDRR